MGKKALADSDTELDIWSGLVARIYDSAIG